jgi:hypothetical protein
MVSGVSNGKLPRFCTPAFDQTTDQSRS